MLPILTPSQLGFLLALCCTTLHTTRAADRMLTVRIGHAGSEAARVSLTASDGRAIVPDGATVRRSKDGTSWFYVDGSFDVTVPDAMMTMRVSGGLETIPQTITVSPSEGSEIVVPILRWIRPSQEGWYSGDSHVHLETGGPVATETADLLLAARAEGLNYVNVAVSNSHGDDIRGAHRITGQPDELSTPEHLIVFGEEMRSSIYGHMQFFGIRQLVKPQYTGFDNTPNYLDFPCNYTMAKAATDQGGVVSYAHPMMTGQPSPFDSDLTASNGAARELPVDAALGVVHATDLMCYNSDEDLSAELWYRLLNCGLRLSACAGTDALLDNHTDPMGGERVYVQVDGPLTMQNWLEGLKRGRTFVTNGPMARLQVNGEGPGHELRVSSETTVMVHATVKSWFPVDRVQIVVNGQPAVSRFVTDEADVDGVVSQLFSFPLEIRKTCWIALKVSGPDHAEMFDGPAWAHTSPVYIIADGQSQWSDDDAAYLVEWIDALLRVVAARNRYPGREERAEVEDLFRLARQTFIR